MNSETTITAVPTDSIWWVKKWDVTSASEPNRVYRVAQDKNGGWGCDCPHWKFRRMICRHIKLAQAALAANGTAHLPVEPVARFLDKRVDVYREGRYLGTGELGRLASWDNDPWYSVVNDDLIDSSRPDFEHHFTAAEYAGGVVQLRLARPVAANASSPRSTGCRAAH